jgi:hypothetical protein
VGVSIMFEIRNPKYAVTNVRNLYSVRKAMKEWREANPSCAWCGRSDKVHVHHKIPVKDRPDLAGDSSNFITLCAKNCHHVVGHARNWKHYNEKVEECCKLKNIII